MVVFPFFYALFFMRLESRHHHETSTPVYLVGGATFSPNGTNAAKASTATFTGAGDQSLQVRAADAGGLSATLEVPVTVQQTFTSISVSPSSATIARGKTQQFTATARDQFNAAMAAQPAFSWSITGSGNSITQKGLATSRSTTGTFTVSASVGGKTGTATLKVTRK